MSLNKKTKKWLEKNCNGSFNGKTVLITGANSGIGFKASELMAYLGANVIMVCRNIKKAQAAKANLLRDYPKARIDIMSLDISDTSSIDAFVEDLKSGNVDVDIFLNNAGIFRKPGQTTKDGFELVMGTNYLGSYYLTEMVLPYLEGLAHEVIYINTISIIHKIGTVDYSDFFYRKHYNSFAVYARSKLCLAKYTYYISQRNKDSHVHILMSHPGIAITPLGTEAFGKVVGHLATVLGGLFNSPEKSALSLPYIIANEPPAGSISGPRGFLNGWGYPAVNKVRRNVKTGGRELCTFSSKQIENALRTKHQ